MEVYKFFKPRDIISILARVSKLHYKISMADDVWREIVQKRYPTFEKEKDTTWRITCVNLDTRSCGYCCKFLDDENFHFCKPVGYPLCSDCFEREDFLVLNMTKTKQYFAIDAKRMNLTRLRHSNLGNVAFVCLIKKEVQRLRNLSKQRIINILKDPAAKSEVEKIDVTSMESPVKFIQPG